VYAKETEVKSAGKAAVGGPFSLVLDDGTPVTDVDFRGRYMLLYFGFTNCPDICPAELRKMMSVVRRLDAVGVTEQDLVPLFISLDPARDTVEQTRLYVRDFGPRLRGLTGTPQQCENAARAYRVYSSKTSDDEEDYLVDHSIVMYLVDRGGTFADYYVMTVTAEEMAERIAKIVKK
jgi:protein SCO1/2